MRRASSIATSRSAFILGAICCYVFASSQIVLADPFRDRIVPFVQKFCSECHNATTAEAQLNLVRYDSAQSMSDDFRQWDHVVTFVQREEMPPRSAKQPNASEREEFLKQIRSILKEESRKLAGDPGAVLPRRLSNAEYDHTIRDLIGADIHPTQSFPVDPAAGEGFSNTGEALAMSPSLFTKLYASAQFVADHALLTTEGLKFAPYSVATFADRAKYCEQAILQFYHAHRIDYEAYLTACYEYDHRPQSETRMTGKQWATECGLSPRYFQMVYDLLHGDPESGGLFLNWLRQTWNKLPPSNGAVISGECKEAVHRLADQIQNLSRKLCAKETEAIIANAGNAPIQHLDRRRKTAAERDTFDPNSLLPSRRFQINVKQDNRLIAERLVLSTAEFGPVNNNQKFVIFKTIKFDADYQPNEEKRDLSLRKLLSESSPELFESLKFGVHPLGDPIDRDSVVIPVPGVIEFDVPVNAFSEKKNVRFIVEAELDRKHSPGVASIAITPAKKGAAGAAPQALSDPTSLLIDPDHPDRASTAASAIAFCAVFPNRFYYVDDTRGLSAGFHLIEGFFRDDQPLCKLALSDDENRELNRLWTELEFITEITEKMLRGFIFFERSERNFIKGPDFDSFKEEDPKLIETATLDRLERAYLDKSKVTSTADELANHPIHVFFEQIRIGLKKRREQLQAARPIYIKNLVEFAGRAFRRQLTSNELTDIRTFFDKIADSEEFGVEQAVRASITRILVSPHFNFRMLPLREGNTVQPISDIELASRLSYFLWSSMPDEELLSVAESGRLHDEAKLIGQTHRMLKDPRVTDFAREFFGQWLGYRDFVEQESVDRTIFKEFDESLKQSMFEEPTRLATWLIQHDRPVTELLVGDATLVDQRLARHYEIPFKATSNDWDVVNGLHDRGRGGILGMAVFLTKNSQPQRTSPVKRGFWVVHKVLGEHIPAPPADVVALPAKETDTNGKSIRELLALHVEAEKCARCHVRFDSMGLSMEAFDRIGRTRTKDLAGRPVDNLVRLTDGSEARGVPEFARHLVRERHDDFIRTLCRKLLGYALGRSLQLSDDVLLEQMKNALDKSGDRFVPLFETIVLSPQFRNQRCRDFSVDEFRLQNQAKSR